MKVVDIYNLCCRALLEEDELHLSYLFGKKLNEISYMRLKKPLFKGVVFRVGFAVLKALKKANLRTKVPRSSSILFFASSINQFDSLSSTICEARLSSYSNHTLYENFDETTRDIPVNSEKLKFGVVDFTCFGWLMAQRGFRLFRKLLTTK